MSVYKDRSFVQHNQEKCEETEGFDVQAGLTWIYPTNYPLRDYQFNIIEQALYKNTLVNLPTGLGKTFIAAVLMFNYYRWYPTGKIVFMAPTRPLVKQQVDACYNITAIPKDVTAELTGTNKNSTRNDVWMDKRVFFITPQVLQNDLDSCPELATLIKCIVFDEAHKAKGNYAYCEVMKKMKACAKYFRVLALSATPGNSINDVGEVINNLMISHLEYRTEESEDVKPYVFKRKLETVVVPLGQKLEQVKNHYLEVLEKYSRVLLKYKVVQGNCSTLTKGAIFRIKKEYQEKNNRDPHYKEVNLTLNICMSLYHANELLIRHGLRGFLGYFEEHINDPLLRNNNGLIKIMEDVRSYLGPIPDIDRLPDGSYPEVPSNIMFGHPKFYRLRDILISHFNNSGDESKVIVFFEYRDSVKEAFLILLQARPIIRPEMFVGQKSGMVTQKMQLRVIKTFRDGDCNTLLSTSIGEEGLDVGEVDLIICFDISNKSPIRMVQRMGRTGRKREGQVVILVTEGREQQTLNDCLFHKNNMKSWAGSTELMKQFFVESPRMVPKEIHPKCMKMQITVTKPMVSKNNSIKNYIKKISAGSTSTASEDVEIIEIAERIPGRISLFNKPYSQIKDFDFKPFCNDYIEHQRIFQSSSRIGSSDASKLFVNLMKFADAKRFNIPLTQDAQMSSKNLKQGDIRNMFVNIGTKNNVVSSQGDFMTQPLSLSTQKELSKEDIEYREFHNKLHEEISIYLSIQEMTPKSCRFCEKGFKCSKYTVKKDSNCLEELDHWIPPNLNFFKAITEKDLESYMKSKSEQKDNFEDTLSEFIDSDLFLDEQIEEKCMKEKSFNFDAPKSFGNLMDKYNLSSTFPDQQKGKKTDKVDGGRAETLTSTSEPLDNSELKKVADQNTTPIIQEKENLETVLSFFKLDKIEDIFEEEDNPNKSNDSDKTIIDVDFIQDQLIVREPSPVLSTQISQRKRVRAKNKPVNEKKPGSPVLDSSILCRSQIEIPSKGRPSLDIIDTSIEERNVLTIPKKFSQKANKKNCERNNLENKHLKVTSSGSTNSEDENLLGFFSTRKKTETCDQTKKCQKPLGLEDVFELSAFGLTIDDICKERNNLSKVPVEKDNMKHSSDLCKNDLDNFSMLVNAESTRVEQNNGNEITEKIDSTIENGLMLREKHTNEYCNNNPKSQPGNGEKDSSLPEIDDFCDLSIFGLTQCEEIGSELQKTENFNHNNDTIYHLTDCSETKPKSTENGKFAVKEQKTHSSHEKINQLQSTAGNSFISESNKIDDSDIFIIEDSPIKGNFIDLTQSPEGNKKPPLRPKILSQLSITQILSLAEKPTQYSVSRAAEKPSSSPFGIETSKKKKKPESCISKSQRIDEKLVVDSNDFENFPKKDESHLRPEKSKKSVVDDSRNMESGEFSCTKESSPIFKKPNRTNRDESKKKRSRPQLENKPCTSGINPRNIINRDEKLNSSMTSIRLSDSILNSNSDDEFEDIILPNMKQNIQKKQNDSSPKIPKKKVRKKRETFDFIEDEAEVSLDKGSMSDDESDDDGSFDESFVDDNESLVNDTQVHANYLQSVRSPTTRHTFKMPRTLRPITDDIFSQPADRLEPNSYIADSFCVNTEDIIEESHELSELEILEQKLKRKRKKRKETDDKENKVAKRRRIRMIDSDSD
ncbi:Fanconi anemia group M protein homolog [Coccinella septempunctata]|uniref:Fanconi anemia group M protein homolog n=1 Tax=Coccinella septempunctata TaxID=41139 RepID=UPI001D095478|nr:Fanconi anemia group M protein homolog [Coccinella septempunctata]